MHILSKLYSFSRPSCKALLIPLAKILSEPAFRQRKSILCFMLPASLWRCDTDWGGTKQSARRTWSPPRHPKWNCRAAAGTFWSATGAGNTRDGSALVFCSRAAAKSWGAASPTQSAARPKCSCRWSQSAITFPNNLHSWWTTLTKKKSRACASEAHSLIQLGKRCRASSGFLSPLEFNSRRPPVYKQKPKNNELSVFNMHVRGISDMIISSCNWFVFIFVECWMTPHMVYKFWTII